MTVPESIPPASPPKKRRRRSRTPAPATHPTASTAPDADAAAPSGSREVRDLVRVLRSNHRQLAKVLDILHETLRLAKHDAATLHTLPAPHFIPSTGPTPHPSGDGTPAAPSPVSPRRAAERGETGEEHGAREGTRGSGHQEEGEWGGRGQGGEGEEGSGHIDVGASACAVSRVALGDGLGLVGNGCGIDDSEDPEYVFPFHSLSEGGLDLQMLLGEADESESGAGNGEFGRALSGGN